MADEKEQPIAKELPAWRKFIAKHAVKITAVVTTAIVAPLVNWLGTGSISFGEVFKRIIELFSGN